MFSIRILWLIQEAQWGRGAGEYSDEEENAFKVLSQLENVIYLPYYVNCFQSLESSLPRILNSYVEYQ